MPDEFDPTSEQGPVKPAEPNAFTRDWFSDKVRGWPLLVIFILTGAIVWALAPQKVGLLLWLLAKSSCLCYLAYWVDRIAFPYARPHLLQGIAHGTAQKRRASLLLAALIAAGVSP